MSESIVIVATQAMEDMERQTPCQKSSPRFPIESSAPGRLLHAPPSLYIAGWTMIVSAVLYVTELLRYVLGVERRSRLKEDRDAGLGEDGDVSGQLEDFSYAENDPPQEEYDGAGRRQFNRNERLLIFTHCQGKCFFCYRPLDFSEGWFAVHLDPTHSEDYTVVTNGVASCRECTGRKAELTYRQFVEQFGGKSGVPIGMRCHGFTDNLVRCEAVVVGVEVFCSGEHHQLYQYVRDNTREDCAEVEEVDGAGRRIFNKNERMLIHLHCKGVCFYCGKRFKLEGPWEADHLVPWSKEGRTTVVNGVLACRDCNRKKSNMTHHEFVRKFGGQNGIYEEIHCHGYDTVECRCFNFTTGTRHYCEDTDGECQKVRRKVMRSL